MWQRLWNILMPHCNEHLGVRWLDKMVQCDTPQLPMNEDILDKNNRGVGFSFFVYFVLFLSNFGEDFLLGKEYCNSEGLIWRNGHMSWICLYNVKFPINQHYLSQINSWFILIWPEDSRNKAANVSTNTLLFGQCNYSNITARKLSIYHSLNGRKVLSTQSESIFSGEL